MAPALSVTAEISRAPLTSSLSQSICTMRRSSRTCPGPRCWRSMAAAVSCKPEGGARAPDGLREQPHRAVQQRLQDARLLRRRAARRAPRARAPRRRAPTRAGLVQAHDDQPLGQPCRFHARPAGQHRALGYSPRPIFHNLSCSCADMATDRQPAARLIPCSSALGRGS